MRRNKLQHLCYGRGSADSPASVWDFIVLLNRSRRSRRVALRYIARLRCNSAACLRIKMTFCFLPQIFLEPGFRQARNLSAAASPCTTSGRGPYKRSSALLPRQHLPSEQRLSAQMSPTRPFFCCVLTPQHQTPCALGNLIPHIIDRRPPKPILRRLRSSVLA